VPPHDDLIDVPVSRALHGTCATRCCTRHGGLESLNIVVLYILGDFCVNK
jgi:hypothetical protein